MMAGLGFSSQGRTVDQSSIEAPTSLVLYFGSSKRGCIFNFVVFLSRWLWPVSAPLHRLRPVFAPVHEGYGRWRPFSFQTMSNAGNVSNCSADGSGEIDLIRYYIDKFDSDDDLTSSGASGVDEDIITELRRRGHCESDQINPMLVGIHHLNRGGVIGNSMSVGRRIDNLVK